MATRGNLKEGVREPHTQGMAYRLEAEGQRQRGTSASIYLPALKAPRLFRSVLSQVMEESPGTELGEITGCV
jgi:hypothetical protein